MVFALSPCPLRDLETPCWGLAWLSLHRAGAGADLCPAAGLRASCLMPGSKNPKRKRSLGGWARKASGPAGGAARGRKPLWFQHLQGGCAPPGLSIKPSHSPQPVIPAGAAFPKVFTLNSLNNDFFVIPGVVVHLIWGSPDPAWLSGSQPTTDLIKVLVGVCHFYLKIGCLCGRRAGTMRFAGSAY